MRILVCGSRSYSDREHVFETLHALAEKHGWLTIIEGGAKGADSLAREWAKLCYHGLVTIPADWQQYGTAAGPIRNTKMLISGKPDLVVAFPGGNGTADMVRQALAAKIEVWHPVATCDHVFSQSIRDENGERARCQKCCAVFWFPEREAADAR
jgi:hypothetical protein